MRDEETIAGLEGTREFFEEVDGGLFGAPGGEIGDGGVEIVGDVGEGVALGVEEMIEERRVGGGGGGGRWWRGREHGGGKWEVGGGKGCGKKSGASIKGWRSAFARANSHGAGGLVCVSACGDWAEKI